MPLVLKPTGTRRPRGTRASTAPSAGRSPLTYVLLVVLALGGHGLLRCAVQAAVRATVPKAVCLLGRPVPGQGTYHHEAPATLLRRGPRSRGLSRMQLEVCVCVCVCNF